MSEDCIFCRIVSGDIPGTVVYEDDTTVAFLDANPLSRGHTLVVPREHRERIGDLTEEEARDLFATIQRVSSAAEDAVDADAANVGFNDGEVAGQEVPHVHGHVVPRFEGDGGHPIHAVAGSRPEMGDDEIASVGEDIADRL